MNQSSWTEAACGSLLGMTGREASDLIGDAFSRIQAEWDESGGGPVEEGWRLGYEMVREELKQACLARLPHVPAGDAQLTAFVQNPEGSWPVPLGVVRARTGAPPPLAPVGDAAPLPDPEDYRKPLPENGLLIRAANSLEAVVLAGGRAKPIR